MSEMMYNIDGTWIAVGLLLSMLASIEIGLRIGRARVARTGDAAKEHIGAVQGSTIGILALLLAFSLSLALQRFESRSQDVVDEANAIGTAYLRTSLLREPARSEARVLVRDYLDLRVRLGAVSVVEEVERQALLSSTGAVQAALWSSVVRATENDPNMATSGLFAQAINELIDSYGRRDAGLYRQVPELVLALMYITFLVAGCIVGLACGVAGHRPSLASYAMVGLIVLLVFVTLDLDRPRRGLITVSKKSLLDLQVQMRVDAAAQAASGQR